MYKKCTFNYNRQWGSSKGGVFSKKTLIKHEVGNIIFYPINQSFFTDSLSKSHGVICNAGFQTTSEVLYLGKRLLAVPVKGQYEQDCNIAALKEMGVCALEEFNVDCKENIKVWLDSKPLQIKFQNNVEDLFIKKLKDVTSA